MSDPISLPGRGRAPAFPPGLDWINAADDQRSLADYRGRLLFLDFWTYG